MPITTSGAPTTLIDFSPNGDHQTLPGGHAYGMWADGPCIPYRGSDGRTYCILPHSENYRFDVGSWTNGHLWALKEKCYESPRNTLESAYANRVWIFGVYAIGATVRALGHMEWYQTTVSDGGHPGFNGYSLPNRRWITSPLWMSSANNGQSWSITAAANSSRVVLVPEPWNVQQRDTLYGFRHPSNIVNEGSYYYCFLDYSSLPGSTNNLDVGFVMIRTSDIGLSTGWQYWNGTGWTTVNHNSYQGNLAAQQPYVFFKQSGWDPYTTSARTNRMAQSIRYHTPSGQWLLFGYRGDVAGFFCYTRSATLATPQFQTNGSQMVSFGSGDTGANYVDPHYLSVFDPAATDQNFTAIGNNPTCITAADLGKFKRNTLTIAL